MSRRVSRREFGKKAAVAGAIVWTVPTITSLDTFAYASPHSAPPRTTQPPSYSTPAPAESQPLMGPALPTGLTGTLPFTGDAPTRDAAVGAVALLAGAALWGAAREPRTKAP